MDAGTKPYRYFTNVESNKWNVLKSQRKQVTLDLPLNKYII